MKPSRKDENGSCRKQTVDGLRCRSTLLLSVVCCIALIHVELRIQEHHQLISSLVTCCDQMESKILQNVQQKNKKWQMTKGSHLWDQRQQTTGRFVTGIYDQVMFEPKAVMPKLCFTTIFSWIADNLSCYKRQPKLFHLEKAIFRG